MGLHHHHHHDSESHSFQPSHTIAIAFFMNVFFAVVELAGGYWTNSMAIVSDAIHDFGDGLSLGFAWYMALVSNRAANQNYSYGYKRFSLLSVLIIAGVLVTGSIFVIFESIQRLWLPTEIHSEGMIGLAVLGIIVNGFAGAILSKGHSLQESVLSWHFWEDVLGWFAVLVGGIVIYFTQIYWIDPLLSIIIGLFVSYRVLTHAGKALSIFLQAVPSHLSIEKIENQLKHELQLVSVHHTHIWTLDGDHHILTSHLVFPNNVDLNSILKTKAKAHILTANMGISHATFEVELDQSDKRPC